MKTSWVAAGLVALWVTTSSVAEAGLPFRFGWTPGTVKVQTSEEYGPIKLRRELDLKLEASGEGYRLRQENVRVLGASGPFTLAQIRAAEAHMEPVVRPLVVSGRGAAVSVKPLEAAVFEEMRATLPSDPAVRSIVEPQLASLEGIAQADADELHRWNAMVGYWPGRDRSLLEPIRSRLPDGRIVVLEHLGPVAEPVGARHLSVTLSGEREGDVRGCSPPLLAGWRQRLAAESTPEELEHAMSQLACEVTEVTEVVTDPDTLRPHLVVTQSLMVVRLPGRAPIEHKTTVRHDYLWPDE